MRSSSIFGGGGVPVGGLVPMFGTTDNPTINGQEYLRTGVLKAISGYASFAASNPQAAYQAIAPKAKNGVQNGSIRFAAGRYYAFGYAGAARTTTALTTAWSATTVWTNGNIYDAAAMNGRVFGVYLADVFSFAGSAATVYSALQNGTNCAVNGTGTLGAIFYQTNAAGGSLTTTDGLNFTSRTTTATSNTNTVASTWQQITSTFAVLGVNGRIYTCTDGFTFTERAVITGVSPTLNSVAQFGSQQLASDYAASTSTVTCFSAGIDTLTFQIPQGYLIRSTDGINFAATPWTSLIPGIASSTVPRIFAVGSTLYAMAAYSLTGDRSVWHSSTDGGLTWNQLSLLVPTQQWTNNAYSVSGISYANGEFIAIPSGSGGPNEGYLSTSTLGATHIGAYSPAQASATGAGAGAVMLHLRIK